MNLFTSIAETLGFATKKRATVHPQYETPNLSANATVASIQSAIRAAEGGDTKNLFSLYRDLTVGGSHIQAELNKRILATLSQPMSVLPAEDLAGKRRSPQLASKEDLAAAAAVSQMIADCENWTDGLTHILASCLWPVTVVEKIFRPVAPGEPAAKLGLKYTLKRLEPVNPQLLCFRKPLGYSEGRASSPSAPSVARAEAPDFEPDLRFYSTDNEGRITYAYDQTYPADPTRHLLHRGHMLVGVRDNWGGPMRGIVFWWLLSVLARDWFGRGMERWGSPFPVGHTDTKNPQAITLLQEAFSLSTKIGGLVVDHDTQVELKEIAAAGMADAYEKFLNVCNREISKVIVGQTLSAEAQSTGLGSSVGKLHSDVREDIRMFDQLKLSETIRQHLLRQCLQINGLTGGIPRPVWGGISDEDGKLLAEVLNILSQAGWEPTDEAVPTISDRLGFPIQRKPVARPEGPLSLPTSSLPTLSESETRRNGDTETSDLGLRTSDLSAALPPRVRGRLALLSQQSKMADSLGVPPAWLNPLRDFLEDLQAKAADRSLTDQDLLNFLDAAVKRVPELFAHMDVDELARVMEAGMGEAVLQGVRKELRK